MKHLFPISLLLILSALTAGAEPRKERLRLKETAATADERQLEDARKQRVPTPLDSATFAMTAPLVTFSGFDKNASSLKETFFVTNGSSHTLRAMDITIVYKDMSGRMLHRRPETIKLTLPPDETRLVTIPALDRQQNLYYHKSRPPRKGGMPFGVEISVDALYQ